MDRFQELAVFIAVAEEEGFAAASRRLQMSPPAVTRAVASLEKRLGIRLLNRTTRHVRMTESGERYLDDARRILAELQVADDTAVGINASPAGVLSVTAPMMFGRLFVLPGVVDYLQKYPQTRVSVALLDRVVNLLEEGFDAGIRIGTLPDSTLRALKVGSVRFVVCASPDYLQQHGEPTSPAALSEHSIITIGVGVVESRWGFYDNGKLAPVRVKPALSVSNNDGALVAALRGAGITRLLSYQSAEAVAEDKLKIILQPFEPPPLPVQIIHREGRVATTKVRAFVDLMAERLRADAALDP